MSMTDTAPEPTPPPPAGFISAAALERLQAKLKDAKKRKRARKIKGSIGPFQTGCTTFDAGKNREVEIVTLTPHAIVYRLKGQSQEHTLPHDVGFLKAASIRAGANIDPRRGRVRRGVI